MLSATTSEPMIIVKSSSPVPTNSMRSTFALDQKDSKKNLTKWKRKKCDHYRSEQYDFEASGRCHQI